MKKVLFFIESLAGGGAEKVLSDIICNLDQNKFDVTVCTVTDDDVYQEQVSRVCNYRSFLHKKNYNAGGIRKVLFWIGIKLIYLLPTALTYRIFLNERYDVEVAFVEGFATKLIASSSNSKSKKIAWVHIDMIQNAYADSCYKNIDEHIATYKKFQKIACVSRSVMEAFVQKFAFKENVCIQYNPVDEKKIICKGKEPIRLKKRRKVLLGTIGRLEEQKGYKRLLECIRKVAVENSDFEVWIIGDGSQRKDLQDYIDKNGLKNIVTLVGFQKNPYSYINCCDAFICSSYAEGFSTAATESLILGKPIFTVDCAGMEELFGDKKCGIIVPNSDDALCQMLKQIVLGNIHIDSYYPDVVTRAKDFRLLSRIQEVESLLVGKN
ncbi:glycosyltransferase [Anaerostipes sp. 992a]|uniref:glycosyltransferase n=1 Tax=Anaerostipes sp. 992a TaxID=1261637 RepID=UPI0013016EF6|nr:glycosyltransferase [Anaerostipes sp. 992a]